MIASIQAPQEALEEEALREGIILVQVPPSRGHGGHHRNFHQGVVSPCGVLVEELVDVLNRALESLWGMILVQANHVVCMRIALNRVKDQFLSLLLEGGHRSPCRLLEDLVLGLSLPVGSALVRGLVNELLPDLVAGDAAELDVCRIEVRPQLSLDEGGLPHPRDAKW